MTIASGTVGALIEEGDHFLVERRVPESRASVEFIMGAVLGVGRGASRARLAERLSDRDRLRFWGLLRKRARRWPLAYVVGTQPFMGLELEVTPDVLVPRPETEELVEAGVRLAEEMQKELGRGIRAIDIGTGSGCIALALANRLPKAFVVATDTSGPALKLAKRNAERLGLDRRVKFVENDLFKPSASLSPGGLPWADVVVSNPPYIPTARIPKLAPEVLAEPRLALDGGRDGLDAIRAVIREAPSTLRSGGWLVLEIDQGLGAAVRALLSKSGFDSVEIRNDSGGFERIALGRLLGKPEKT